MIFDMKALGFLILLTVGSKASINKLFFLGSNVELVCPLDAPFYQWKKYHNHKMTNIFQDDKKKLNISLKLEESPIIYECGATSGFDKRNVNITVYVLDRNSKKAQTLCFLESIYKNSEFRNRVQYPCFIHNQKETINRFIKGTSLTFDCEASGTNVIYTWYKIDTGNNRKDSLIGYNNSSSININEINEKSVGQYVCEVSTSTGRKLERVFIISSPEDQIPDSSLISIETPETINITAKSNKKQKLDCRTDTPIKEKVRAIQWGKRQNIVNQNIDKNQIISWEGKSYKLLSESQVSNQQESENQIMSSLILKDVTHENTGEYICVIVTNSGLIKYKTFHVSVSITPIEEENRPSFFFLYILIPSLIIAVCLFIGIYLTINRRPTRKSSNFNNNNQKVENDTVRLRTTPDYSAVQYQANSPSNLQYPANQNYYNPYYPTSDKLII